MERMTWKQLEASATRQGFELLRSPGCVTVYDGPTPLVTITTDQLESEVHAGRVVRAALAATLNELERIDAIAEVA